MSPLTNGTAYTFTVTATNANGTGQPSAASNSVTPAGPPGAPTIGTVTAGNAQATVIFTPTPPASNGGSAILYYTVTSSPGNITATGAGSPIIVTGLTNGTAYTLTLTATNALGTSPGVSSSVTPYTVPGAPAGASATAGNTQATVTFTAPASTGGSAITLYTVTSSPGNITATSTTVTPITVSPLTNGTAYAFTVTAANLAGSGPASSPSSPVTPAGAPGAPTGVSAAPGNAQALVSFTPPASNGSAITGYTVTSYSSGGATGTDANAGSTSTAHTVTGLTNGIAYTFTVTATNVAGTSLPSGASTPVTPYTTPGIPTGVNATAGNAQATISFSAPASTGGSAITFYTVTSSAGQTASGSSSPITVTGLINGTGYTFTVTATNAAGTGQASSASNQVTPGAVPGAPTAVSATAGNAQATVTFTAPALTGGAITGYTVTSSPSGGLDTGAGTTSLSHLVTGLTNGTAYTFTVTATNAVGPGPASSPSSPVTPAAAPGAPTGVSATAGNAQAQVFFTPPASNGGSVITGYTVTSNSSGGAAGTDANAGSTSTAHTVTGLTNGIAYTFTVTATNSLGTATSSPSSPVTPYTAPGAPTIGTATAGNAQVSVTFSIPTSNGGNAITGYTVTSYFNGVSGVTASGPSSPITVSPLTPGIAYTFTVMATNAAGNGQPSGYSNPATPYALPGAPTGASATAGNGNATVTFTAAAPNGSAITGYTVTSNPSGGLDTGAGSTSLSHLVTGLTNGTAYTFTVTATNAAGNGPASNASTPVTPAAAPGAPTAVTATAGNAQALVSFTPPASNGSAITGYTVTSNSSGGAAGTDANARSTSTAHTVTGLTNGIAYTFTVTATNVAGTGLPSGASNPVTPAAVPGPRQ